MLRIGIRALFVQFPTLQEDIGYVDSSGESKGLYFTSTITGAEVEDAKGEDGKAYAAGISEYDKNPLQIEMDTGLDAFGVMNPEEYQQAGRKWRDAGSNLPAQSRIKLF